MTNQPHNRLKHIKGVNEDEKVSSHHCPSHAASSQREDHIKQETAKKQDSVCQKSSQVKNNDILSQKKKDPDFPNSNESFSSVDPSLDIKSSKTDDLIRVKRKHKRKSSHKKLKVVLIVLLSLVLLITLLTVGVFLAYSCGKNSIKADPIEYDEGKVVYYNGSKYTYNENIISTLFVGYDQKSNDYNAGRSGQADFILLLCFDTETGVLNAVSIPRDTMVEVGQYVGEAYAGLDKKMQIALAYAYGDGAHSSCENTKDAVSRLLYNMPIKNYVSLNMEGIGPINDSIGGVSLIPLETIPNSGIYEGSQMTLMGKNAQKYVQYRNTKDINSSEMRRKRDIQYATEFFKQMIGASSNKAGTILNLFTTATQYITTNLGIPEVTYLAQIFSTKDIKGINITSIDGTYSMGETYVEYNAESTKLYETVLNLFYTKEQ